jgi:heme-degrading monooxygenase HmoA
MADSKEWILPVLLYSGIFSSTGELSMITRIWYGRTNLENADAYEELLRNEIFTNIAKRSIKGYQGIHLLRRDVEEGVEFVTIMWFETLDAVREFAGEEYEVAVVPSEAKQLLSIHDDRSKHYQVIEMPK